MGEPTKNKLMLVDDIFENHDAPRTIDIMCVRGAVSTLSDEERFNYEPCDDRPAERSER